MLTDIEIAQSVKMKPIKEIAASIGIKEEDLELYGNYKAKVVCKGNKKGKLILVTAINPTPAGEGKTTVTVGLGDAFKVLGKSITLALREPSLGPVFGIKGGAAGGGWAQVVPMDDLNLHFTGDIHAVTAANNLLSAMIDNHVFHGNELGISEITWHRCMDMNDRALRRIIVDPNGTISPETQRDESFDITTASEAMAILCLASDPIDLKRRLGNIIIGYNKEGKPVTARDLKADNPMAILLKDAIKPNLVQTIGGVPVFIHGGPFANIAHGCNSIIATKTALSYADYVVTEAGFGADLGAEKFLDIKCRKGGLEPDAIVLVATARALKYGGYAADPKVEDLEALSKGLGNLEKHIENIKNVYKMPVVVAINRFVQDTDAELKLIEDRCAALGVECSMTEVWAKGGEGGVDLAKKVIKAIDSKQGKLQYSYPLNISIKEKIEAVATKIYGADGVDFEPEALRHLEILEKTEAKDQQVCIAKTQYSLTDDPKKLGRPTGFRITVRDVVYRGGAEFTVVLTGKLLLMPGLPKVPAAAKMTIDENGKIEGLF